MNKLNFSIILLFLLACNDESKKKNNQLKKPNHKIEHIKMNGPEATNLSKEIIEQLSANDIVYAELAEGGAMGNTGGIIIYALKDKKLIRYKTSLFDEENYYAKAQSLLLKYQDKFVDEKLKVDKVLFNYHYGGMGNHVFVNKKITLKKGKDFFTFTTMNNSYKIYCSVQGVFNSVAYSIDNLKNN